MLVCQCGGVVETDIGAELIVTRCVKCRREIARTVTPRQLAEFAIQAPVFTGKDLAEIAELERIFRL